MVKLSNLRNIHCESAGEDEGGEARAERVATSGRLVLLTWSEVGVYYHLLILCHIVELSSFYDLTYRFQVSTRNFDHLQMISDLI